MNDSFVPEADRLEQETPVEADRADADGGLAAGGRLGDREANEADILDQAREVPLDEDEVLR